MAKVVKVIELMSQSRKSWEDAAQGAVDEASKTLRNIRSLYIKEFTVEVRTEKSAATASTPKSHSTWSVEAKCGSAAAVGTLRSTHYYFFGLNSGNRITSRMDSAPVSSMVSRSIPSPKPPAGGMPCSSASKNSSSTFCF